MFSLNLDSSLYIDMNIKCYKEIDDFRGFKSSDCKEFTKMLKNQVTVIVMPSLSAEEK